MDNKDDKIESEERKGLGKKIESRPYLQQFSVILMLFIQFVLPLLSSLVSS